MNDHTESFRTRSHLTAFLYEILRDHLPAGVVEKIVQFSDRFRQDPDPTYVLSNGHLARYAEEVTHRLTGEPLLDNNVKQIVASDEIVVPVKFLESFMADWAKYAHPAMSVCDMKKHVRKLSQDTGASHLMSMVLRQVREGLPDVWQEKWDRC